MTGIGITGSFSEDKNDIHVDHLIPSASFECVHTDDQVLGYANMLSGDNICLRRSDLFQGSQK